MVNITYDEFINNILSERGRFNCGDEYCERHHIIPKCCGGTNDKNNLIDLFPKEHFIAHKLLANENSDNAKLVHAYSAMAFMSNDYERRYELTPEEYQNARIALSELLKEKYKNKESHPSFGKHISDERKKLISRTNKGNKYCLGRKLSDETKRKIGEANKNKGEETRMKMSKARKGKNLLDKNPHAKPIIRLSDGKVYSCIKIAAQENNINYSTLKSYVRIGQGYTYLNKTEKQ